MADSPSDTFLEIEQDHERLQETLLLHQDAMVRRDLPAARRYWDEFCEELRDHMQIEDEILIPEFARLAGSPNGCSPEILNAEHRKIERLIERSEVRLLAHEASGTLEPRQVVLHIEEERTLKEVLDHHHTREGTAFFPVLDALLSQDQRRRLLERCRKLLVD